MLSGISRPDQNRPAALPTKALHGDPMATSAGVDPVLAAPPVAHDRRPAAGAAFLAHALTQTERDRPSAAAAAAAYGQRTTADPTDHGIEWYPVFIPSVDRRI